MLKFNVSGLSKQNIDEYFDKICEKINISSHPVSYTDGEGKVLHLITTSLRKRKTQVEKICEEILPPAIICEVNILTLPAYVNNKNMLDKSPKFKQFGFSGYVYSRTDIQMFDKYSNLLPWQRRIYNYLFIYEADKYPDCQVRLRSTELDRREILALVDTEGNTGKSVFFKWLLDIKPNNVGRFTRASAQQLRSRICKTGPRDIYIVDLPRTKGFFEHDRDLLNCVEDCKNGLILDSMFGSNNTLIFDPPWIVVSSNVELDYNSLSSDRWKVFNITRDKKLVENRNVSLNKNIKKS